ncbi:MAG: LPS export ABC transporter periplasmic protein LptC [Caulobacteraceae bacterium]
MSSPTADIPGLAAEDIERRRRLLKQWRRHSALIAVLRKLLPALCVAIIVALGAWSAMSTLLWRTDNAKVRSNAEIRMLNPVFQGRTEEGKPFLVTAASAVRDNVDSAKVTLEHPVLNVGAGTPAWTKVTAARGVYHEDTRMLDLAGQVTLDDYRGNHLATEHALADTLKDNVQGETPISGHGPLGSVDASSYSLENGGAVLSFAGRVKTRIVQHAQAAAAPSPAGK